jgi:predicted alpha/beta hydrolase family esterase
MKTKQQILMIHGGTTFKNQKDYLNYLKNKEIKLDKKPKWAESYFDKELGKNFQIIKPHFPLQENAKYNDWKIWFERYIPLLNNNVILIGGSLGGIFLAKYLSENKFPKKILSVYMICPPFDDTCSQEDLVGGFKLKSDLSLIEKNCKDVALMFSEDDDVVPVSHAKKYRKSYQILKL